MHYSVKNKVLFLWVPLLQCYLRRKDDVSRHSIEWKIRRNWCKIDRKGRGKGKNKNRFFFLCIYIFYIYCIFTSYIGKSWMIVFLSQKSRGNYVCIMTKDSTDFKKWNFASRHFSKFVIIHDKGSSEVFQGKVVNNATGFNKEKAMPNNKKVWFCFDHN